MRRETLSISRAAFPADHLYVSGSMYSLGRVLVERGKLDEAEPLMLDALELIRRQFPADSPRIEKRP